MAEKILPREVEARVDWFTATTRDQKVSMKWLENFRAYKKIYHPDFDGDDIEFYGYAGTSVPGFRILWHPQHGSMIILSGDTAKDVWLANMPEIGRVTRLDLAATFRLAEPIPDLAEQWYNHACSNGKNGSIKRSIIKSHMNGMTYYIGARTSRYFGRMYDKSIEANVGEPGTYWRFEVEIKKPSSTIAAQQLYNRFHDGELIDALIVAYVRDWFRSRDVDCWLDMDENILDFTTTETRIKSIDRTLAWLKSQVRPSVSRLIRYGMSDDVLKALGIYADDGQLVQQLWGYEELRSGRFIEVDATGIVAADDSREV